MNYQDTIDFLFKIAPLFQQKGGSAYKEGLVNTEILDTHFGHPHKLYHTIHVGGTNGKGSTAHTLAAILQSEGYKVGLYTSPHLLDFRERIRVNGRMISEKRVIDFVTQERYFFEPLYPSFFELTTALAFLYFAEQKVDIAVIEVGLGGRLDCTNIISPLLSIITNISLDHTQFLGETLSEIAREKAGIIKKNIPVVIGETLPEVHHIFEEKALEIKAPIFFAEEEKWIQKKYITKKGKHLYDTRKFSQLKVSLTGQYQEKNTNTILSALSHLPFNVSEDAIRKGFSEVETLTGLQGRWQIIEQSPLTICDTGHNIGGWQYLSQQLSDFSLQGRHVHIVFGMVYDKDISSVLSVLPPKAYYYFTQAQIERAMPAEIIASLAKSIGLSGNIFPDVRSAVQKAQQQAQPNDVIYIGGSTFVVADFLKS